MFAGEFFQIFPPLLRNKKLFAAVNNVRVNSLDNVGRVYALGAVPGQLNGVPWPGCCRAAGKNLCAAPEIFPALFHATA